MGKFEKRIKKKINCEQKDFDIWFEKNRDKFGYISEENRAENVVKLNYAKVKYKNFWIPFVFTLFSIILCLSILLICLFTNDKNDFNLDFGDDKVYTVYVANEELDDIVEKYKVDGNMTIVSAVRLLHRDDGSIVFTILDGEIETEDNYYFVSAQIEHNSNYVFLYKLVYQNLPNHITVNEYVIDYDKPIKDTNDLYVYYLRRTDEVGQVVYFEIHCLEDNFDFILNNICT